jgi:hypothetical protein
MGTKIGMASAWAVEGLTKVINLVGVVSPGNVGTYEGGNMLIANVFGLTTTAGLTLALCRRTRTIFWAAVGAAYMAMTMRRKKARVFEVNDEDLSLHHACIRAACDAACD